MKYEGCGMWAAGCGPSAASCCYGNGRWDGAGWDRDPSQPPAGGDGWRWGMLEGRCWGIPQMVLCHTAAIRRG